jgi:hypothetical protein
LNGSARFGWANSARGCGALRYPAGSALPAIRAQ